MEKRKNNITIALTDAIYAKLKEQAEKERRPLAQYVALLVVDSMEGTK